ncbi:hypothetical protein PMAA_099740 [Lasallia pustulata]|uniref:Uncharacterized protein n=1 Tax=Lasallia pustulata TaxID=136370 RepID=A0A1W5CY34_9LECA|nr:hypothetical protein PMAA_099740 [Lasallia pustulata]
MTAIIGLQIDDTLIAATLGFMEIKSKELNSAGLLAKPCKKLTTEHPLEFNGFAITLRNIKTIINQAKQIKKIQLLSKSFTKEQYIAQQAQGAYIITKILWIKGDKNPADAMTKEKACNALQKLVDINWMDLDLDGWVERQE